MPSEEMNESATLKYAVGAIVYLSVYILQFVIATVIYEKYAKQSICKLLNLCSMTNISILILPFDQFGFYIHGRYIHKKNCF